MANKHDELENYLRSIAKEQLSSESSIRQNADSLKKLYDDNFQHFYSRIFSTMAAIKGNPTYNLQNLVDNMRFIFEFVQRDENEYTKDFIGKVKKLYDHINLDFSRMKYTEKLINDSMEKYQDVETRIIEIKNTAERMQREYVTILGIFAAIILAFVSGMIFSTSVLNNINQVSVFHLTFVMILIAMFLFNMVNFLTHFIRNVSNVIPQEEGTSLITMINRALVVALLFDVLFWLLYT